MTKRTLLLLGTATATAIAIVLAGRPAEAAQNAATAAATSRARIITAISITKVADLKFGDVVPGASAGTVRMTPAGVRTSTGGTTLGNTATAGPSSFNVAGQPNATYQIVLPNLVTVASGASTMRVNTFRSTPTSPGNLGAAGSQTLAVGATLHVAAAQAAGTYTANFNVTVSYN
jgi:hypothetical protein